MVSLLKEAEGNWGLHSSLQILKTIVMCFPCIFLVFFSLTMPAYCDYAFNDHMLNYRVPWRDTQEGVRPIPKLVSAYKWGATLSIPNFIHDGKPPSALWIHWTDAGKGSIWGLSNILVWKLNPSVMFNWRHRNQSALIIRGQLTVHILPHNVKTVSSIGEYWVGSSDD